MANAVVTVLESDGVTQTDVTILDVGRQAAAASKSYALSTEDKNVLDAMAASLAIIDNQQTAITSIAAGTNNIGDVDIASIAAGDNNIGNVDVVTLPALPAGTNNIGDVDVLTVIPGTTATSLGKAVDAVQGGTDTGVAALVVRDDVLSTLTPADGDYTVLRVDSQGRLHTTSSLSVSNLSKFVTVAMSAPTAALDAGDVVADTQIIAACAPTDDAPGLLQSLTVIDTDDQKAPLRFVFFSSNVSLGTENSAPSISDANLLTVLGHVDVIASDYVDYGGGSVANIRNIGLGIVPATGTDDIYMAIYTPSGAAPTYASGTLTTRLGFI